MPCDLKTNTCCLDQFLVARCISKPMTCPSNNVSFGCLQATDCPSGQVCCGLADSSAMTATTSCATIASGTNCPGMSSMTMGYAQFCQTDGECKNHQACIKQSCPINSSLPPAVFKLCGLQNHQPYNCTASP
jgi:hypothetical protein